MTATWNSALQARVRLAADAEVYGCTLDGLKASICGTNGAYAIISNLETRIRIPWDDAEAILATTRAFTSTKAVA